MEAFVKVDKLIVVVCSNKDVTLLFKEKLQLVGYQKEVRSFENTEKAREFIKTVQST